MKKPDEIALLGCMLLHVKSLPGRMTPRLIGIALEIPDRRVVYLCEKWADGDWYDYGVTADLGWLTDEGIVEIKRLLHGDQDVGQADT